MKQELNSKLDISYDFSGTKIAIVQSTYHRDVTDLLYQGCVKTLEEYKVGHLYHIEMPGAYELAYGAQKAIELSEKINSVIVLGCVIKGDTDHDVYINQALANGFISLEQKFRIPIGFGLLTVNTHEQAMDRAGGKHGNKGEEAALAILHALSFRINKI